MPVEKPHRCLVMGCGSIGQRHMRNLISLNAGPILAYDVAPASLERVRTELGVETTADLQAAWNWQPDLSVVAASSEAHCSLALEAAKHNCDIFVEKPLSHNMEGVDLLIAEAEARNLITMVGCNMRFHPGPAQVKRLLEAGEVGEIFAARVQGSSYLPRWRPLQNYRQSYSASVTAGGAVLDYIHEIDLALWYLGPAQLLASVSMPAWPLGLETDGMAEMILRHQNGAITNLHLNYMQRDYRRGCQMIGTRGTIYWDFEAARVWTYDEDGCEAKAFAQPEGWQVNQMYLDETIRFLNCVDTRTATDNSLRGGRAALEIALAARNSKQGTETR